MTPAAPAPGSTGQSCDHTSVGVLISSSSGFLLFERATPLADLASAGLAPVAGHVDQHGSPEQAAHNEVTEEVGLTVTQLQPLLEQWRPNRCRRTPTGPVGHHWWLFQAEITGALRPSPREVRAPRWSSPGQLQQHALRTAAYAGGHLSPHEFAHEPGLEPVWCLFLHALELITLSSADLDRIDTVL